MAVIAFEWKTDGSSIMDEYQHLNSLINFPDEMPQIVHSIHLWSILVKKKTKTKTNLSLTKPLGLAKWYRKHKEQRNWLNNMKGIHSAKPRMWEILQGNNYILQEIKKKEKKEQRSKKTWEIQYANTTCGPCLDRYLDKTTVKTETEKIRILTGITFHALQCGNEIAVMYFLK